MHRPVRGGLWLRWATILCGVALLIWMSLEDTSLVNVAALAVVATTLATITWARPRFGLSQYAPRAVVLTLTGLGALTGAGSAITATVLMLFKDLWHAHPFPDFPPGLLAATLTRLPAWGVAGALVGLAVALAWLARATD